jgi:hypothetical protein
MQLPVDHGVPGARGIHQVNGHLGVLDAASSAGVLALHPNRLGALLEVPGLVNDQHRLGVAQVLDDVGAHVIADLVFVPHRPAEQVLHPVGAGVAGVLGDRPAVLTRQIGQQPEHEHLGPPSWLHSAKPTRDPIQQLVQARGPSGRVYAVACGHRLISGCPHNTGSSTVATLICSPASSPLPDQPGHDLRLEN